MRPVLPRISSQESGFFFCGMRLLPVEYSSGRIDVGKFLGGEDDKIFGQAREMRGDAGEREKIVESEIAIADGVEAVRGDAGEIQDRERWRCDRWQRNSRLERPNPWGMRRRKPRRFARAPDRGKRLRACAIRKCDSRIGWACCMCVMPAMGVFRLALACPAKARISASSASRISPAASMTNRRKSVATSSLRLRPVCSFHPSGPSSSTNAFSTKWCTSSAEEEASQTGSVSARCAILSRAARVCCTSAAFKIPAALQGLGPGAINRDFVGQQPAIEREGVLERVE